MQIAQVVRALEPNVAITSPLLLERAVGTSLFPSRFAAQVIGAFGIVGLILGALGIYGVLSYQVSRRTRELGVRRALGASAARIVLSVLSRAGMISMIGCTLGVVVGALTAHLSRGLLFGIQPLDPVAFTAVPVVLLVVALMASLIPARRAGAVEPTVALRAE